MEQQECFTYTSGRKPDEVCTRVQWSDEIADYSCNTTVNKQSCNSCSFQPCNGSGNLVIMDCTNQPDGEVLDRCIEDKEKSNPHTKAHGNTQR